MTPTWRKRSMSTKVLQHSSYPCMRLFLERHFRMFLVARL
jgi:hypothetical protein